VAISLPSGRDLRMDPDPLHRRARSRLGFGPKIYGTHDREQSRQPRPHSAAATCWLKPHRRAPTRTGCEHPSIGTSHEPLDAEEHVNMIGCQ
jgi:hypothetical protein